jgi:hypothetical protein
MEGHCFSCSARFWTVSDDERLCPRCRPPVTWGASGEDADPQYLEKVAGLTSPFTVVVDTREQRAYRFVGLQSDARKGNRRIVVPTIVSTIPAGDYSINGYVDKVAVERKTLDDFCQSFGRNREREERKVGRLSLLTAAWYMLEFRYSDLQVQRFERSEVSPKSLRRTLMAMQVRYPAVHWFFAGDRRSGEAVTYRVLEKWWWEWVGKPMRDAEKKERAVRRENKH